MTELAILLPGKVPQGKLRALDFNVIAGSDENDPQFLTIVDPLATSTASNTTYPPESDTLYKVGVTLPVKFFFLDLYGQHDFESGEPQLSHIGGDICRLCRSEQASELRTHLPVILGCTPALSLRAYQTFRASREREYHPSAIEGGDVQPAWSASSIFGDICGVLNGTRTMATLSGSIPGLAEDVRRRELGPRILIITTQGQSCDRLRQQGNSSTSHCCCSAAYDAERISKRKQVFRVG